MVAEHEPLAVTPLAALTTEVESGRELLLDLDAILQHLSALHLEGSKAYAQVQNAHHELSRQVAAGLRDVRLLGGGENVPAPRPAGPATPSANRVAFPPTSSRGPGSPADTP